MKSRFFLTLPAIAAFLAAPVLAADGSRTSAMGTALLLLALVSVLAIALCAYLTASLRKYQRRRRHHGKPNKSFHILMLCSYTVAVIAVVFTVVCAMRYSSIRNNPGDPETTGSPTESQPSATEGSANTTESTSTETETTVTEPEPDPLLHVGQTGDSDPDNWGVDWDIITNEAVTNSFTRGETITFGNPLKESYFSLPGIATFRGDNYRTGSAYGTASVVNKTLTSVWTRQISALPKSGSGSWTGSGWTGQPLVVQWDEDTKQIMNLYPEKKAKSDLVEVIYATLDGYIYFYDLEDGTYTRDPMYVGMAFKGAGALDPRGYPLFYVGSGDKTREGAVPRMYVISLIDCTVLYTRGNDEPLRNRSWRAFDSSPLVDAETDTLIWPGECGLLYTIKLNTDYNKKAGTISVNPDASVMTRYTTADERTYGYESSTIIVENYIYIADNGGMLFCVDLNTMKLQWAQNTHDDNNATPVFEWGDDGEGYLYCGTSMEFANGTVYITKYNASTGEIVWEMTFDNVYYDKDVSGGILGSPVLGKKGTNLEGLIIYPIARAPGAYSGILVALDTETGEIVWEKSMNSYAWSSPVAIYTDDNVGYIILCDSAGNVHLMDGTTGQTYTTISVGSNVEATPVVYENMMVVGTRGQLVYGIEIG